MARAASEIEIVLIRVGATPWDEAERVSGSCDLPLSDAGLERTRSLATEEGEGCSLSVILCGEDEASRQTAGLFSAALGGRIRALHDLGGVDLGLWEGLRRQELDEKFPTAARQWREDPSSVTPPGGEGIAEAQERIVTELVRAIDRCRCEGGAGIGIALRPVALAVLLAAMDNRPLRDLWAIQLETEDVTHRRLSREQIKAWRERVGQPARPAAR